MSGWLKDELEEIYQRLIDIAEGESLPSDAAVRDIFKAADYVNDALAEIEDEDIE